MEKLLNQHEIDAMVRAARGTAAAVDPVIVPFQYAHSGKIGREQLEAVSALHEGFARRLTHSIGAYLRIGFQAGLVSAEHQSYREFLGGVPETSYLGSVEILPVGIHALLQMDLAVAFPLIDVLLGGQGVGQAPSREVTEIEEQILEMIMRIICRELQNSWQALGFEFNFEQRQHANRVQHLLPAEERILGLSFEVTMKDCKGLMSIPVPAVISSALLRQLATSHPRARAQLGSPESSARLKQRLLNCPFRLDLELKAAVTAEELACLENGKTLVLRKRAEGSAQLLAHGQSMFEARIARLGKSRAAQITSIGPPPGRRS